MADTTIDQITQPPSHQRRLNLAPAIEIFADADQQLDRQALTCALVRAKRSQRTVRKALFAREDRIDGGDHGWRRTAILVQRYHFDRLIRHSRLALAAKDLNLCASKSIDRLLLIADRQERRAGRSHEANDGVLQTVGILKLVDHHLAKALLQRGSHICMRLE